jgi:thiol-disulfide isomerase/thioredoxin
VTTKKLLILIILGTVVYFITAQALSTRTGTTNNSENATGTEQNGMLSQETQSETASDSEKYVVFTPEILADTANTKRVLFFYANWCPTCKPTNDEFTNNSNKIPNGVTVIRVNYNDTETDANEKALATKYGVTYQHTFVQIDNQDNVITKWNGGSIDKLVTSIKCFY